MSILRAVIVPHPPLTIPTMGRERKEVLIITSSHQIMYADYFHISPDGGTTGDMSAFGAAQTKPRVKYDAP